MTQYIEYKGKQIPFVVDLGSITKTCGRLNLKLSEFDVKLFDIPGNAQVFIEECLSRGLRLEGIENKLNEVDFENIYVDVLTNKKFDIGKALPDPDKSKPSKKK